MGIETAAEAVGCAIGKLSSVPNKLPNTSAEISSEIIAGEVEILAAFEKVEAKKHCENLVPLVEKSLKEAGAAIEDLDLIVVDVGPGLYTGLRVGIATAKFLAYALKANGKEIKCLGISSLDLLAFQFLHNEIKNSKLKNSKIKKGTTLFSAIDAKRGEVFYASYNESELLANEKSVAKPQELLEQIQKLEGEKICVGSGAMLYADIFKGACEVKAETLSAEALVHLSATFDSQSYISPENIQPMYLRNPDIQ